MSLQRPASSALYVSIESWIHTLPDMLLDVQVSKEEVGTFKEEPPLVRRYADSLRLSTVDSPLIVD